jgi:hypothetical protein
MQWRRNLFCHNFQWFVGIGLIARSERVFIPTDDLPRKHLGLLLDIDPTAVSTRRYPKRMKYPRVTEHGEEIIGGIQSTNSLVTYP